MEIYSQGKKQCLSSFYSRLKNNSFEFLGRVLCNCIKFLNSKMFTNPVALARPDIFPRGKQRVKVKMTCNFPFIISHKKLMSLILTGESNWQPTNLLMRMFTDRRMGFFFHSLCLLQHLQAVRLWCQNSSFMPASEEIPVREMYHPQSTGNGNLNLLSSLCLNTRTMVKRSEMLFL